MDEKEMKKIKKAVDILSCAFDASEDEIIDCMTGVLISQEEAGKIKAYFEIHRP